MQGVGEAAFGATAGLVGLAYSSLTFEKRPSIVETILAKRGDINRRNFSLAISRDQSKDKNGGWITFGDIPDLAAPDVNVTSSFAKRPLEIAKDWNDTALSLYAITVDGFAYSNETHVHADPVALQQFLVDSGAPTCTFPTAEAAAFNAMFDPPAVLNGGNYDVKCTATPPKLVFVIDSVPFAINPVDLVVDLGGNHCISGVQTFGQGIQILGDPFLKNVLAVFDIGNSQMKYVCSRGFLPLRQQMG